MHVNISRLQGIQGGKKEKSHEMLVSKSILQSICDAQGQHIPAKMNVSEEQSLILCRNSCKRLSGLILFFTFEAFSGKAEENWRLLINRAQLCACCC